MPQHHHRGQQQRGGVGQSLSGDIGCGTVNGLEDGSVLSNVTRWRQTETSDKTGTHVGQDVSVQVGHDHDGVGVRSGVLDDLHDGTQKVASANSITLLLIPVDRTHPQTNSVQEILVVDNVRVLLGDISTSLQEHSIRHPHDGRLVNGGDLVPAVLGSVVEGVSGDSLGGFVGDKLDGLYDTGDELWAWGIGDGDLIKKSWRLFQMLVKLTSCSIPEYSPSVFSLMTGEPVSHFPPDSKPQPRPSYHSPNQHRVDIIISGLVPLDAHTRPNIGKQPKRPPQRQVHRNVTLSDRGGQGTFESDRVLSDRVDGFVRDGGLALDEDRGDVYFFPFDRGFGSGEDGSDGVGDFGTDTISGHHGDGVFALQA